MGVLIMGMSMHDRYYEPEDEEDFDEEIAELLNGDFSPDLEENIKEAFMNIGKTLLKGLSMINYLIWFFGLSGAATWAFVIFVIANICLQLWNQEK